MQALSLSDLRMFISASHPSLHARSAGVKQVTSLFFHIQLNSPHIPQATSTSDFLRTSCFRSARSVDRAMSSACVEGTEVEGCRLGDRRKDALSCVGRRGLITGLSLTHVLPACAAIVDEDTAERVFDSVAPSIVSISNFKSVNGEDIAEGTGSGIVWDTYGHIVTNYHCIARLARDTTGSQKTVVGFTDAKGVAVAFPAEIVGLDAQHDLAVLKVDALPETLRPIKVGTSGDLRVGQSVYAVGNPFGLSKTLTAGLVSGLNRMLPSPANTKITGVIQTDASISRGSSGGALLDSSGRLVGVSTATFTRKDSARSSGVNFALPVDLVYDLVPKLIIYGSASAKGVRLADGA